MDSDLIGKKPFGYIYVSFFPPTNKKPFERFYIGQKKFTKRNHYSFDPNYHGSGRIVFNYLKKNPNTIIRTVCLIYAYSQEELNRLENYWVSFKLKGKDYPDSFNLRSGGLQSGWSEETRKRMSQIKKGKPNTPEQKIKISGSLKGKPKTESHKIAAGIARRGVKHSEESKRLMRQKHLEYLNKPGVKEHLRLAPKRRKDVICLDTMIIYISSMEASRQIKTTSDGAILMCCKKLRKQAGGYHWMFLDDYLAQNQQSSIPCKDYFEFSR
jgi:hypothetical protein